MSEAVSARQSIESAAITPGNRFRYPGPESFADDPVDRRIFFGRDREVAELADRIVAEQLTVLYGKSGLGKTSLLQAGLFPRLRRLGFAPVVLRPSSIGESLLVSVREAIEATARRQGYEISADEGQSTVAGYLAGLLMSDGGEFLMPVLVFDQFEEIFRAEAAPLRREFIKAIGPLVGRNRFRVAGGGARSSEARVLLSLREEYVGALEEFSNDLPGLLANRYRLGPLQRMDAQRAIERPATLAGAEFVAPDFELEPGVVNAILDFLEAHGELEPILLQIICQHIEREVIARDERGERYTPVTKSAYFDKLDASFGDVLGRFYLEAVAQFGRTGEQRRVRNLCEFGLVRADGKRDSVSRQRVREEYGLDVAVLDKLVAARLLRQENRLNDFWYELTHDRVAEAVAAKRRFRLPRWAGLTLAFAALVIAGAGATLWVQFKSAEEIERLNKQLAEVTKVNTEELLGLGGLREPPMVTVPAGSFRMGDLAGNGRSSERPVHEVTIAQAFKLSAHEVTFEQYDQFATATSRQLPDDEGWGRGSRPVINVSWDDAVAYTAWLGKQTGQAYRLPSEAEWEYAARAGTDTPFHTGQCLSIAEANYNGNYPASGCDKGEYRQRTLPVGSLAENAFGLYDMHGNVWEWVLDCWHDDYAGAPADGTAWGAVGDSCRRVLRGGSWYNDAQYARSADRNRGAATVRSYTVGFRVAQDL